jgi:hypothetical protein
MRYAPSVSRECAIVRPRSRQQAFLRHPPLVLSRPVGATSSSRSAVARRQRTTPHVTPYSDLRHNPASAAWRLRGHCLEPAWKGRGWDSKRLPGGYGHFTSVWHDACFISSRSRWGAFRGAGPHSRARAGYPSLRTICARSRSGRSSFSAFSPRASRSKRPNADFLPRSAFRPRPGGARSSVRRTLGADGDC